MDLARAGRVPGLGSLLRNLKTPLFIAVVVVLSVLPGSATAPAQSPVPQQSKHSPVKQSLTAGTAPSGHNGLCNYYICVENYTGNVNSLPPCYTDKDNGSLCNRTASTSGLCKEEDPHGSVAVCHIRCLKETMENRRCSPGSDLRCLPSGSNSSWFLVMMIVLGVFVAFLVVPLCCWKYSRTGCHRHPKYMDKVFSWCRRRSPPGPGVEDNARNESQNNRDSCSTLDSQQTMECQELAVLTGVTVTSPWEEEHLLGPTEAKGSQMRRPQVPANGTHPIDKPTDDADGPKDSDIPMARPCAEGQEDALYELLV